MARLGNDQRLQINGMNACRGGRRRRDAPSEVFCSQIPFGCHATGNTAMPLAAKADAVLAADVIAQVAACPIAAKRSFQRPSSARAAFDGRTAAKKVFGLVDRESAAWSDRRKHFLAAVTAVVERLGKDNVGNEQGGHFPSICGSAAKLSSD